MSTNQRMPPADEARKLVWDFIIPTNISMKEAKICARIAVKKILSDGKIEWAFTAHEPYENTKHYEYWNEVLQEINKQ